MGLDQLYNCILWFTDIHSGELKFSVQKLFWFFFAKRFYCNRWDQNITNKNKG